ncbi:SAM-dependent methyltransferase [Paenibacillus sp. VTT E-133280]|jgi:ubiquinone/menaquinone biosynthesis C-methylase UbiE|uniref:class I SAM-dependent methyltransferase n=1 Tax=unclassified Paenibacillus TaxID=185978 RepID=UPI000BA00FC3|nr:class I SAM-dependent methyltransferase [Paenibacillus sp. VTT E-133280]OZQ63255.1 SAM-dependent methyltransferase [Paenibacillus sp. VTT E-133280]
MGLLNTLIDQAKNPRGFVGNIMIKIMNQAHTSITAWGLKKIQIINNAPILDIGCGGGQTIHMLSNQNKHQEIYGIDYSQQAVETSIQKNNKAVAAGRVKISRGDVSALPFNDGFFGTITAIQTHYFWPDLEHDISEVFRVLKAGGTFVMISEIYKINYHMKKYTKNDEIDQLFRQSGFQTVNIHENNKWRCYIGKK